MKSSLLALAFAGVSFCSFAAKTVYVDCKLDSYTGHDGTSWEKALKTLADGVVKCSDGDTMLVAKGVYDEGTRAFNSDWGKARLEFCNKHMYVKAVDGPLETFIVGEKCTFTENADGSIVTNYVRCIQNYNGNNSVVEGFTLMNGDTGVNKGGNHNWNGSVVCADASAVTWLVNCNITGNYGAYDMIRYANLVNCCVTNNHQTTTESAQVMSCCSAFNTLVYNNRVPKNGDMVTGAGTFVNCTLINNRYTGGIGKNIKFYNSIFSASGNADATTQVGSSTGASDYPVMSTITCDVRVRKGATAETAGNGKYRTAEYFPSHPDGWVSEEWRTKDLRGIANSVSTNDTTIMAGCLQMSATQATQPITFSDEYDHYSIDNGSFNVAKNVYFIGDVYPTQVLVRVEMPAEQRLVSILVRNAPVARLLGKFPEPDQECVRFTPAAASAVGTPYEVYDAFYGPIVWTDPKLADYTEADGSSEHPYQSLQDALDKTTGTIVIQARAGTYGEGGKANAVQQSATCNYRFFVESRYVRLIGVSGAENTIIMGAPDPDHLADASYPGLGPKAYKCIGTSGAICCIDGVTLTGGYTSKASLGDTSYTIMGGAVCSVDNNVLIRNSIITNNHADTYSVAHYVRIDRCVIRDNHSRSSAISSGFMTASVLGPNDMTDGVELYSSLSFAMNCTIIGDGKRTLTDNGVNLYNTVLVNGKTAYVNPCYGSVIWNVTTVSGGTTGFIRANPLLCGDNVGYGRLFKNSPALTAGTADSDVLPAARFYLERDFDGNVIDPASATQFAGAYGTPAVTGLYVTDAAGLDGVTEGVNFSHDAAGIEIAPKSGWTRPIVGAIVNGEIACFNDTDEGKLVYDAATVAAGNTVIQGLVTSSDWYVDVNGSDLNDGYFAKKAKRTLKAALENANLASNDRVLVLPGTYSYADGTMEQADFGTRTVRSVAVVPNYVTLESTGGPAVTIIQGKAGDTEDPKYYDNMTSMHGIGPGAVRCVLLGLMAKLKGFTLKDGHVRGNKDNPYYSNIHNDREFNGGGVTGSGSMAYHEVVNCVIDNCAAFRGGATFSVTCYNCEFKNSFAIYGGGASSDCRWIQCLSHDNECHSSSYRAGFFYGSGCFSSTIIDGYGDQANTERCNMVTNCIFYGLYNPNQTSTFDVSNLRNCAFNSNAATPISAAAWANLHSSSIRVPASELQFDDSYRPVVGANQAIDRGTPEVMNATEFATHCATDKNGGQRIYNGTIDIGCLEADWRTRYASDIAKRGVTVTIADPTVVESDAGTVRLPAGAALNASLNGVSSVPRQVSVRVTGSGTLTVKLNDQVLGTQTGAGEATFEVANSLATNQLSFDYAGDDGYAEILKIYRYAGMAIILQ